jgi:hypothetical protein
MPTVYETMTASICTEEDVDGGGEGGRGFFVTYRNRKNANEHANDSKAHSHARPRLPGLRLILMMHFLCSKVVSKLVK